MHTSPIPPRTLPAEGRLWVLGMFLELLGSCFTSLGKLLCPLPSPAHPGVATPYA